MKEINQDLELEKRNAPQNFEPGFDEDGNLEEISSMPSDEYEI